MPGGFLGVDIFFVISGFLITWIIREEQKTFGSFKLGRFLVRRYQRLTPLLVVITSLVIIGTWRLYPGELSSVREDALGALTYTENWHQLLGNNSYFNFFELSPLRHTWSLAIEEQFYLIWPTTLWFVGRAGRFNRRVTFFLIALLALTLSLLSRQLFVPGSTISPLVTPNHYLTFFGFQVSRIDFIFMSTVTRGTSILVGVCLGILYRPGDFLNSSRPWIGRRTIVCLLVLSLGVIAWALFEFHVLENQSLSTNAGFPPLFRWGFAAISISSACAIVGLSEIFDGGKPVNTLMKPIRWLGTRSYGIYLVHWPIFQFFRHDQRTSLTVGEFLLLMTGSCAIAEICCLAIERPFRSSAESHDLRSKLVARLIVCITVVGAVIAIALPVGQEQLTLREVIEMNSQDVQKISELVATTSKETPIAVGDSVMLGAAKSLASRGVRVDAELNRDFNYLKVVLALISQDELEGRTFILHLTNNTQVESSDLAEIIDTFLSRSSIVVLNSYVPKMPYDLQNFEAVLELAQSRPSVVIADWRSIAQENPHFLLSDGLHLDESGQSAYADLIMQAIGK